jgi:hypothetical protein
MILTCFYFFTLLSPVGIEHGAPLFHSQPAKESATPFLCLCTAPGRNGSATSLLCLPTAPERGLVASLAAPSRDPHLIEASEFPTLLTLFSWAVCRRNAPEEPRSIASQRRLVWIQYL